MGSAYKSWCLVLRIPPSWNRQANWMRTAPRLLLSFFLSAGLANTQPGSALGATAAQDAPKAALQPAAATAPDLPLNDSELQAESQLFQLVNQSRREAGAPPLTLDAGLSHAAHIHARAMQEARQLSHQCEGEPSLPQRLAIATSLQLDQEAENVALDYDPQRGHEHLMHSPPHRANLLNPAYNVVGLGVVRSGDRLYIVQDFGHALPDYSATELKDHIAAAVNQTRRQANQPELQRRDLLIADTVACSMAEEDKIGTVPVRKLAERFTVLTYTSQHPETLPDGAAHAIASRTLGHFSVGACFARTDTYPTGVYWIVLSLE
jgi:uncharacterized protein YkwD